MSSKYARARKALSEFMRTSNPQDEFFVIAFNDRPAVVVDYTNNVDDIDARMVMLKPTARTALDIASRISAELRNEYVVGYKPTDLRKDGQWRKLKVKLNPPPGLPQLNVHNRTGYYAPSE